MGIPNGSGLYFMKYVDDKLHFVKFINCELMVIIFYSYQQQQQQAKLTQVMDNPSCVLQNNKAQ